MYKSWCTYVDQTMNVVHAHDDLMQNQFISSTSYIMCIRSLDARDDLRHMIISCTRSLSNLLVKTINARSAQVAWGNNNIQCNTMCMSWSRCCMYIMHMMQDVHSTTNSHWSSNKLIWCLYLTLDHQQMYINIVNWEMQGQRSLLLHLIQSFIYLLYKMQQKKGYSTFLSTTMCLCWCTWYIFSLYSKYIRTSEYLWNASLNVHQIDCKKIVKKCIQSMATRRNKNYNKIECT